MSQAQEVPQSLHEVQSLLAHLETASWVEEDWGRLPRVLREYERLLGTLCEVQSTLTRLQALIFGTRRRHRLPAGAGTSAAGRSEAGRGGEVGVEAAGGGNDKRGADARPRAGVGASDDAVQAARSGGHRPGHGRLEAEAYAGAERVECRHEELAVGPRGPVWGQGRLYALPPGVERRIDGNALLSAMRYELEKLRCSACGEVFTAKVADAAGAEKYRPRARAVLAVRRYYLGLPLYRGESYQAMRGVPVPDATPWDQIEKVGDCAYVVFEPLETLAAQGELSYQDDTAVRILSLIDEHLTRQAEAEAQGFSQAKERTGMHPTALVVQVEKRTIVLYSCGRAHAGENLAALLEKREAEHAKPLGMSDALSSKEADAASLIRCPCLAHGHRKCSDLADVFPVECPVVIEALKQGFDHDEHTRDQQMSAQGRLAYHQAYSRPIMDALKRWLDKQVEDRLVEPNSSLGKAIASRRGPWETLTPFLSIPGAPLENNLVERALQLFIRQRKNSLFDATEYRAYMASVLTSLIATCLHAGVNALEYLVALQAHRAEVFAEPSGWFPWTYQARLIPP